MAHVTIITNRVGPCSKRITLSPEGLQITPAANVYDGHAQRVELYSLHDLDRIISVLGSNRALVYGVPSVQEAKVITQGALKKGPVNLPDLIARDKQHFNWPKGRR